MRFRHMRLTANHSFVGISDQPEYNQGCTRDHGSNQGFTAPKGSSAGGAGVFSRKEMRGPDDFLHCADTYGDVLTRASERMITIKPPNIPENSSQPPDEAVEEHKKTIPLVWIPATLVVGLLIAGIYLGGRIVAAHGHPRTEVVSAAAPTPPKAVVTPPVVESGNPESKPDTKAPAKTESPSPPQKPAGAEPLTVVSPEDGIPMITPSPGQVFIQVGALDQEATRRFVQHLRADNLDPHVAPGPTPQLMRVLIGPFDNRAALNEKKAQIESEGIDTFVRKY
ncbi:MAG: SPOR domain-containing protein [Bryobacteraceae bacterium]